MRYVLAILALLLPAASAHDWYPAECCYSSHCRPTPCDVIKKQADGTFEWREMNNANPSQLYAVHHFEKAQASPDGRCHTCTAGQASYCLFLPPKEMS